MLKKILAVSILASMALAVSACNTTKGAGKDIERAGEGMQNAADKNR